MKIKEFFHEYKCFIPISIYIIVETVITLVVWRYTSEIVALILVIIIMSGWLAVIASALLYICGNRTIFSPIYFNKKVYLMIKEPDDECKDKKENTPNQKELANHTIPPDIYDLVDIGIKESAPGSEKGEGESDPERPVDRHKPVDEQGELINDYNTALNGKDAQINAFKTKYQAKRFGIANHFDAYKGLGNVKPVFENEGQNCYHYSINKLLPDGTNRIMIVPALEKQIFTGVFNLKTYYGGGFSYLFDIFETDIEQSYYGSGNVELVELRKPAIITYDSSNYAVSQKGELIVR